MRFFKKRYGIVVIVVVVAIVVYVALRNKTDVPVVETATVMRGDVRNEVSVTGRLKPVEHIDLSFVMGGRVDAIYVEDGDHVERGDSIARLDTRALEGLLEEARARLERERAVEAELLAPLRTEERAVQDAAVMTAKVNLFEIEESSRATLARIFTDVDDALHNHVDTLYSGTRSLNPKFGTSFTYGTTEYMITAEPSVRSRLSASRADADVLLEQIKSRGTSEDDLETLLTDTDTDLRTIEVFLDDLARVVNAYIETDVGSQAVYVSYQTALVSARTTVSNARTDVLAARKAFHAARLAYSSASSDLALALAGASRESIDAERAAVVLAERGVAKAEVQLEDGVLRAPFAGTIANFTLAVGEVVSPYTVFGQLTAPGEYILEAYIPEADIAEVKSGDIARSTLDAFSTDDVFTAQVIRIAESETLREGVPTYKTFLSIISPPDSALAFRAGMSVDVDISTAEQKDTLYVPTRSILTDKEKPYVRIWNDESIEERAVTVGLRGSEGYTEILSGVQENEEVILFIEE